MRLSGVKMLCSGSGVKRVGRLPMVLRVIPSGARNPSCCESQEKRDSSSLRLPAAGRFLGITLAEFFNELLKMANGIRTRFDRKQRGS
jgi:hypothetical protein